MKQFDFASLARANPKATQCQANIRQLPEHFQVEEQLPFAPDGSGGQAMLYIEKTDTNTDWLAKQLAQFAEVPEIDVGYAGLKDRHAVTSQWFSVKLEGRTEPDWHQFNCENWQIKSVHRHNKKLKRGVLAGNRFSLTLTDLQGSQADWQQSLEFITQHGVPNYFAEQRFGHQFANLVRVDEWFNGGRPPKKRQQRSLLLSAARSWLFNLLLSERVRQGNWDNYLAGDMMQLAGTRGSLFTAEADDSEIADRLKRFDIHPTGPLWGRGEALVTEQTREVEQHVLESWATWRLALEKNGLKQERRSLRLYPQDMQWAFDETQLDVQFFLPSGCYATAVLRELAIISDVSHWNSGTTEFS